jgi:hypothetical protein
LIYLFDTNAIIYHLRGATELDPFLKEIVTGSASPAISIITQIELLGFPRLTRTEETRISALLSNFVIRDVDQGVAGRAVVLRRKYRLALPDCIIAATAQALDACLISRDAELGRIHNLRLINPFRAD